MKRSTIKEAFGGEVRFTKFIADNIDVATKLLDVVDMSMGDDYRVIPEDKTIDSKRVDLTVNDSDGTTVAVIESQDATGWLDTVHSSKIMYYMWEKQCNDGILVTEDADENVKGFVRYINENTPFNIWLVASIVYETDTGPFVDFYPVMRPFSLKQKKVQRKALGSTTQTPHAETLQKVYDDNTGLFTNVTAHYVSRNRVAPNISLALHPKANGCSINFYHNKKLEGNKSFETAMQTLATELGTEANFNRVAARFNLSSIDEAVDTFRTVVNKFQNKEIVYS